MSNNVNESGYLPRTFFVLSNPYRIKIHRLCLKEKLNITEIAGKIGLSYKSTFNHIKLLEEIGLIKKTKEITKKGSESFIKSKELRKGSVYKMVYDEILKEQKLK